MWKNVPHGKKNKRDKHEGRNVNAETNSKKVLRPCRGFFRRLRLCPCPFSQLPPFFLRASQNCPANAWSFLVVSISRSFCMVATDHRADESSLALLKKKREINRKLKTNNKRNRAVIKLYQDQSPLNCIVAVRQSCLAQRVADSLSEEEAA